MGGGGLYGTARDSARDGALMSYGADFNESFERAASLVDRIFKGAKPADLPFEEPTRYLFVIKDSSSYRT